MKWMNGDEIKFNCPIVFFQEFKKELEEDIRSDTSGDFRSALIELCKVRQRPVRMSYSSGLQPWSSGTLSATCCSCFRPLWYT